jgi:ribosome-binding factor A
VNVRIEKINEQLKIEVSDIILRDLRDPRIGFVTVTDAQVTKDLRHAKVYISVMGDAKQQAESLAVLQRAAGHIRAEFGRRVHMKVIPEIVFKSDAAVEHGMHIFELLEKEKRHEQ